jgi:hypothetical protein
LNHGLVHLDRTRRQMLTQAGIEDRLRHKYDLGSQEFAMLLGRNEYLLAEVLKIITRRQQLSGIDGEGLEPKLFKGSERDFIDRAEVMKERRLAHARFLRKGGSTERVGAVTPQKL